MKTITLITLLILSFVGYGQTVSRNSLPTQALSIYNWGETQIQKQNKYDKEFMRADSAFKKTGGILKWAVPEKDINYLAMSKANNDYKINVSSKGVITINIDNFKVGDTIFLKSGKNTVGIPAYKFLEYMKDEPPTIIHGGIYPTYLNAR